MIRSSLRILRSTACISEPNVSFQFGNTARLCVSRPGWFSTAGSTASPTNSESASTASSTEESRTTAAAGNGNGSEVDAKLAEKDKLIEEKDKLLKELEDKYKRSLAENQNVLQRGRKQVEEARLFGIRGFCRDLLEVADILEKATTLVPKEELEKNSHLKNLFEGLTMTETQLQKVFTKNGLEKMNPEGEKFNPHFHEAVFQFDVPDKEDGTVAVVQKLGYTINGVTLRAALVGVVKKNLGK